MVWDGTMEDKLPDVYKCSCGAVSFKKNGQDYCCKPRTFRRLFGVERVPRAKNSSRPYGCCDHCVNHWGLDLCRCGSGKAPHKCKEGLKVCGRPMQVLEQGTYQSGWFAERNTVTD